MKLLKIALSGALVAGLLLPGAALAAVAPFDTNQDGAIRIDDVAAYLQSAAVQDINGDGFTDAADIAALLRQIAPLVADAPAVGSVAVRVVDQLDEPVNTAAVTLNGSAAQAVSDGHGRYTFAGVQPAAGNTVSASAYDRSVSSASPFAVLAGEEAQPAKLRLELPTVTVKGTVCSEDLQPLVGVQVKAGSADAAPAALTDALGRFELAGVPVGERSFTVTSATYGLGGFSADVAEGMADIAYEMTGVKFVTVSGIAQDAHYNPIVGASITMHMVNGYERTTTSGADGRFSFNDAIANVMFGWSLQQTGYRGATYTGLMAEDSATIVDNPFYTAADVEITDANEMLYATGTMADSLKVSLGGYSGIAKRSTTGYALYKSDEADHQTAYVRDFNTLRAALADPDVSTVYITTSFSNPSENIVLPNREITIKSDSNQLIEAGSVANDSVLIHYENVSIVEYSGSA
ncbi:hypothetical protein B5M42_021875 [Paenibacillus athensensis]|uniref:Dockerin domain-containing protein n=1 Tax=Paenibacillus athensensis TaxID=1967502 RepID=A0A4Y8PWQ4_9BACL|nr:hypothetical protein [Paenibacillus athensensis]MCD1261454.1 hypothetical protein [Paenibacillus athensensis]